VLALLAPAVDDEQRVVDGHTQPDEGDEELHDEADVGDVGRREHAQERRQDRHGGDDQGHEGEERREDEDQDDERAGGAEQRLREHARRLRALLAAVALRQLEVARGLDGEARRLRLLGQQRLGQLVGGQELEAGEALVHHDAVGGPTVVGREGVAAGGAGVAAPDHAVLRELRLDRGVDAVDRLLLLLDGGAVGDRDGDDAGALVGPVAVALQQLLLVSKPCCPGSEKSKDSRSVVVEAVATPPTIAASQNSTTSRRWRRTNSASRVIGGPPKVCRRPARYGRPLTLTMRLR
jgi:hypothetical protein